MVKYALSLDDFIKVVNNVVEHDRECQFDQSKVFTDEVSMTLEEIFKASGVSYDTIYTHSPGN